MPPLTDTERQLLNDIRAATEQLAKKVSTAQAAGFNVAFNINGQTGVVDRFEVTRMVPVDFSAGTN